MAQLTSQQTIELAKKVFGKAVDALPVVSELQKDIQFLNMEKIGDSYKPFVLLEFESGITFAGTLAEASNINPAVSGAGKQAEVSANVSVMNSLVPWGFIARTAQGGEKSFYQGTKHIFKQNQVSHARFLMIAALYGRDNLGHISYLTGNFRAVALTTGTGTINSVAFTNGRNAASKAILLDKSGSQIFVGMKDCPISIVTSADGLSVLDTKIVRYDAYNSILYLADAPPAATAVDSHVLKFPDWVESREMRGMKSILTADGDVFGINNSTYSLWKGGREDLAGVKFTQRRLENILARASMAGGLDGDLVLHVHPLTWAQMLEEQTSYIRQKGGDAKMANGARFIEIQYPGGVIEIKGAPMLKESDAVLFNKEDWCRIGSVDISWKIPGLEQDLLQHLENQMAAAVRSFSDQAVFCYKPARSVWISGIDHEASS